MTEPIPYPEHVKLAAIADKSQAIGEFLEYLSSTGLHLQYWYEGEVEKLCPGWNLYDCRQGQSFNGRCDIGVCKRCNGSGKVMVSEHGWVSNNKTADKMLAEFFGIDLVKLEQEKRAMLEKMRQ